MRAIVDEETVRALFPHFANDELAERWGMTVKSVTSRGHRLGLTKTPETIARTLERNAARRRGIKAGRRIISDDDVERLISLYVDTPTTDLYRMFGVTKHYIDYIRRENGLPPKNPTLRSQALSSSLKGHVLSLETRTKIRRKALGRIPSAETRRKQAETHRRNGKQRGPLNYNWKGGPNNPRLLATRAARGSSYYAQWRKAVAQRDNYTCQQCGRVDTTKVYPLGHYEFQCHHIKPWATHPELRFDVANGVFLCCDCHNKKHGRATRSHTH